MAKRKKLTIRVAIDEYERVIVAVYDIGTDGYATCVRESVLDPSSALQLGFELQRAYEDIIRRREEKMEELHGRKTIDIKVGRH